MAEMIMQSGPRITVLVVDDEPKVRLLLRRCLESDGYVVIEASNIREVDKVLQKSRPDLITLDLQLGDESGLSLAAKIRANSEIPIIMVTGKGDVIDKVVGLEMGADDYISKPFHVREVLARVRTVLRRTSKAASESDGNSDPANTRTGAQLSNMPSSTSQALLFEGWQAKPDSFELYDHNGELCDMTTADFKLLMVFLQHSKKVLSRDRIMDLTNGIEWTPNDRTIDNQVARLRKKIEADPANPRLIKTIRGIGYMFTRDVTEMKT